MDREKDAFYVVKKGDIIGVYKCLNDCQALLGSSVRDPSVNVFKGYGLRKEAEDYLVSNGLKNAVYSVAATDVEDRLFGQLSVCPFQQPPSSKGKALDQLISDRRLQHKEVVPTSIPVSPQSKHAVFQNIIQVPSGSSISAQGFCTLEFDGASKGNPGLAGAGAVLRVEGGSGSRVCSHFMVCRLREGVGIATNNVAEYRALLLGLNYALQKGYKHIRVQGDSKLVVMQVQGLWKLKNQNMADLCKVAKELKDRFLSFEIRHVERDLNSAADVQANLAIHLKNGEVQEEWETK
ncbi:uncharacterized protein LOC131298916 isoform X1 [Rhododendron vialii]|uniref:uncharacterized protein LOC131298916 isoform X1 n=1 Tax=Rhododendron vialii TaxID=182163 RepID=UPI00265E94C4|nr:uncharacterized protein LOC131298916 isoform X1 [Rhododendron vialii]XP_058180402.1 uncharacterized protein LOC131298916 isoform X1 [Rhododendron vialii]